MPGCSYAPPSGGARPLVRTALVAALLAVVAARPATAQLPAPAISGPGLLHLAGYGSVAISRSGTDGSRHVQLAEAALALLASGTLTPALSYFGELEVAGRTSENWAGHSEEHELEVERLYAEYAVNDLVRIRAGRFLVPVGQWNETHAAPLTWTALRPLTTYRAFAKSATGAMLAGSMEIGGHDAGYTIFIVPRSRLEHYDGSECVFSRAVGGRIAIEPIPDLFLGTSLVQFRSSRPVGLWDGDVATEESEREEDSADRRLLGADLSWRVHGVELLAEAIYVGATPDAPREQGAFVQAAIPLVGGLSAVARSEYYRPIADATVHVHTLGAAYRTGRHITFKLARQIADQPSPVALDGWFVSASALF